MSLEKLRPTAGETVGKEGIENDSQLHSTQSAEVCQGAVTAALRALHAFSYQDRASKHEICHMLGLSSPRVLQELINQERKTAPICSSASGGYWLGDPESEVGRAEISSTASTMERRAIETFRAAAALRRWTRLPLGQVHLEECSDGETSDVFS